MQKYQIITWLVYHIPFKITKKMIFRKRSVMIKKIIGSLTVEYLKKLSQVA